MQQKLWNGLLHIVTPVSPIVVKQKVAKQRHFGPDELSYKNGQQKHTGKKCQEAKIDNKPRPSDNTKPYEVYLQQELKLAFGIGNHPSDMVAYF